MRKLNLFLAIAISITAFWACQKESTATNEPTLQISLTDGPGDFESVLIDVIGAEIHINKDTGKVDSWVNFPIRTGIYDILKLSNGVDTVLGSGNVPLGDIKEIRLKLGSNNSVKVKGKTYPLSIASGDDSGLKLKFEKKLLAGVSYKLKLDFDAAKSIREERNGYRLRPVLRLITDANDGAIRGEIASKGCKSIVYAINGVDTVTSAYPSSTGKYVLQGLDAGTYTVAVQADSCNITKKIEGVKVVIGKSTEIPKISF